MEMCVCNFGVFLTYEVPPPQGWKIWGGRENFLPGTFNLVNAVSQAHFVYFQIVSVKLS